MEVTVRERHRWGIATIDSNKATTLTTPLRRVTSGNHYFPSAAFTLATAQGLCSSGFTVSAIVSAR